MAKKPVTVLPRMVSGTEQSIQPPWQIAATGFRPASRGPALKLWTSTPHHSRGHLAYDLASADFAMVDTGLAHAVCVRDER